MIKKQQKWIALLVTLAFVWLLQVSTMPVAAANAPEQTGSASAEQGPDFVEAVGSEKEHPAHRTHRRRRRRRGRRPVPGRPQNQIRPARHLEPDSQQ
jgi:hypothetical protein